MRTRLISYALLAASTASPAILKDVRDSLSRANLAQAEAQVNAWRAQYGVTPEWLEALSWVARAELAAQHYDKAETLAQQTYDLSVRMAKQHLIDSERHLSIALGAAIEVHANVLAARGDRSAAIGYLQSELTKYRNTSLRARIQKNLNLLTLTGKRAPVIDTRVFLGTPVRSLAALRGRPVLLFFWAHWCGDCKSEVPVLSRLAAEYGDRLAIVGPTKHYGYVAQGEEATPDAELKYIDQVRLQYYAPRIPGFQVPVSDESFKNYGASTTPTIVLVDAAGIVRLYHPGTMSYDELNQQIRKLMPASS